MSPRHASDALFLLSGLWLTTQAALAAGPVTAIGIGPVVSATVTTIWGVWTQAAAHPAIGAVWVVTGVRWLLWQLAFPYPPRY